MPPERKRKEWVWMPHAAHLIVGRDCRFHLATVVNGYLISTVGEYLPDSQVREIMAQSRKVSLEGKGDERLADFMRKVGYEEIGFGRKYETMVFRSSRRPDKSSCCPYTAADWSEIDFEGYNKPEDAYSGHLKMCRKWNRRKRGDRSE